MSKATRRMGMEILLSIVAFLRTVIIITSFIAWSEQQWITLALSLVAFAATTHLIRNALDTPTRGTIEALIAALNRFADEAERDA